MVEWEKFLCTDNHSLGDRIYSVRLTPIHGLKMTTDREEVSEIMGKWVNKLTDMKN